MPDFASKIGHALRLWLFRQHGPEPAPIVLNQRRIFVLPTRAGLVFGATVILLLIGSINYFLSLGYMLTFLLAGLGIVGIIHAFRNLVRLEISPGHCEPVFAGDPAMFSLLIRNRRRDPRPALRLHVAGGASTIVDAPGNSATQARVAVSTHHRGWQSLPPVTLETSFPLELIRAWSYVHPDMRCLVYPTPEADAPPLPHGDDGLQGGQALAVGSDDFAGLRGHQQADSPRHIAWKAAAREGPLLTKQFAAATGRDVRLDWRTLPEQLDTERRLSRLAAWVLSAHATQTIFSLRLPTTAYPAARGEAHVRRCLQALALHGAGGD
jgi:uncharacterized protein (DUF58 family)